MLHIQLMLYMQRTCSVNFPEPSETKARRTKMLLEDKVAVIYGAGGAIGGAVARTFAREGAKVFLSGRTLSKVQRVAREIIAAGRTAEAFQVHRSEAHTSELHSHS